MTVSRWLEARRPPMPEALGMAVARALAAAPAPAGPGSAAIADHLADAGMAALARVARSAPERSIAPELLAADALLTYACEAAAEAGPEALDRLTDRLDLAHFAALLEPER